MTNKVLGLVFLGLIIGITAFAQNASTEQLTVPLSSPGKPYSLKVQMVRGSIKVVGSASNEIQINATPRAEDERRNRQQVVNGMKRIDSAGSFEVTAKEADNNVTVNTGNPNKAVDLELKIPQDVKLKLGTVNGGEISVDNVSGQLEISNTNDKITLTNISGSVVANTVNGDITVTFSKVDTDAPMAFSTLNGDVSVTLPSGTKANLKMKSDNGEIFSDFDVVIDKTPQKTEKTSSAGMYKIKRDDWVYGKINGGGAEMMMKNMQGNLYLKTSSK